MFGRFPLDRENGAFAAASERAFQILARTVAAQEGGAPRLPRDADRDLVLAWSVVHGFASLALDGQMPFVDGPERSAAIEAMARRVMSGFATTLAARA